MDIETGYNYKRYSDKELLKHITNPLLKMLNKMVRFNLNGPILLQLGYDRSTGEAFPIITNRAIENKSYIEDIRNLDTDNKNFSIPDHELTFLTDFKKCDNTTVFPTLVLSSKGIVLNPEKSNPDISFSNGILVFPRYLKLMLSDLTYIRKIEYNIDTNYFSIELDNANWDYYLDYKPNVHNILKIPFVDYNYNAYDESVKMLLTTDHMDADITLVNENPDVMVIDNNTNKILIFKEFVKGKVRSVKISYIRKDVDGISLIYVMLSLQYTDSFEYIFYRYVDQYSLKI